ncbi:uncharacterized protein LOC126840003 isoform X2 [Adelges cooleyi]|nr:uncharacterized protein LOC126840003 isoform X2 [Adelges cooleyi]
MIQPLLFVYGLFSVCTFLMCSAGNPGSWSDAVNVSKLNNMLKASGWEKLFSRILDEESISTDEGEIDLSDLLNKGEDGNIVTPANNIDKFLKCAGTVNCFYGENLKFINTIYIEVIVGHCMSHESDALKLDCMERYWETIDKYKSLLMKMLKVLNFFHEASKGLLLTVVIDTLEFLVPFYDRENYTKSKYLDENDTIMIDNLKEDNDFFLDKMNCANKMLQDFLVAGCSFEGEDNTSDIIAGLKASLDALLPDQRINSLFQYYDNLLIESEKSFLTELGIDEE